jgi:Skp family chaperone for outer membrane proteins
MSKDPDFAAILADRLTPSGRACVNKARCIFKSTDMERCAEARQWIKLAIAADDDQLARKVKDLEEKFGRKGTTHAKHERLKQAAAGNVVPLREVADAAT